METVFIFFIWLFGKSGSLLADKIFEMMDCYFLKYKVHHHHLRQDNTCLITQDTNVLSPHFCDGASLSTMLTVKISNIMRTKSQNLNVSRLVLQLSLRNILKLSVQWRVKMYLEQRRQAMLQLHLNDQKCDCLLKCVLYYRLDAGIPNVTKSSIWYLHLSYNTIIW